MKRFWMNVWNMACYCGLSKEGYREIKAETYESNFLVWKSLQAFLLVVYAVLTLVFLSRDGFTTTTVVQLSMTLYFGVVSILFWAVLRPDSQLAQFLIYLSMLLLLISAMLISLLHPETIAVTFIVLLVMLPMFMIDKPYFMAVLLVCAVTVYLWAVAGVKPPAVYRSETVFMIAYGGFGVIVNTFYNHIRIREFTLQKRELKYIEEEKKTSEKTGKLNTALK